MTALLMNYIIIINKHLLTANVHKALKCPQFLKREATSTNYFCLHVCPSVRMDTCPLWPFAPSEYLLEVKLFIFELAPPQKRDIHIEGRMKIFAKYQFFCISFLSCRVVGHTKKYLVLCYKISKIFHFTLWTLFSRINIGFFYVPEIYLNPSFLLNIYQWDQYMTHDN